MQPASGNGVSNSMQLVGRVEGATKVKGLFVLTWQKLVSPTGVTPLLEFLSQALQTMLRSIELPRDGSLDKEMACYDFGKHLIFTPDRKFHVTEARAGTETAAAPITNPGGGSIKRAMERVAQVRAKSPTGPLRPRPEPTQEIIERDDGVVEMFGMKISKEAWERLDSFGGPTKRKR